MHSTLRAPQDLAQYNDSGTRRGEYARGLWRLRQGRGRQIQPVANQARDIPTTNNGETAVIWAFGGGGTLMRTEWDHERLLRIG